MSEYKKKKYVGEETVYEQKYAGGVCRIPLTFDSMGAKAHLSSAEGFLIEEQLHHIDFIIYGLISFAEVEEDLTVLVAIQKNLTDLVSHRGDLLIARRKLSIQNSQVRAALQTVNRLVADILSEHNQRARLKIAPVAIATEVISNGDSGIADGIINVNGLN